MKNVSTKITYMVIGSLLTLIGYHFGNVETNSAVAQKDDPIVDEIRCRRLVIVGEDNTPRIVLETEVDDSGRIAIGNQDRELRLLFRANLSDGVESGSIAVIAEDGKVAGVISSDMYGGYMAVHTRNGSARKPLAQISTTEDGDGLVVTRDKTDQEVGLIGGEKNRTSQERYRDLRVLIDDDASYFENKSAIFYARRIEFKSEDILLQKGNKLLPFNFSNDVKGRKGQVAYIVGSLKFSGNFYDGPLIWFAKKGDWIELTNGTRYTCNTEDCIINMETYTILKGEIYVSYKDTE